MSVLHRTGNLFSSKAQALGHGVNTKGVMGAGIAREFAQRFPLMKDRYVELCESNRLRPGGVFSYLDPDSGKWVFNLASQVTPGPDASLFLMEDSLSTALFFADSLGLDSFAIPRIGCGIGGLGWGEVRPLLIEISESFPHITLEIWTLNDSAN